MRTLILGLGNLLLADEGVGVHAAHALLYERALSEEPDQVVVLDIGTAVLEALPALEDAERVIVLDAVAAGGQPGTVYRIPLEEGDRNTCIASVHGFDFFRALALTRRKDEPEVILIGVEPARIEWSLKLSPLVASALPFMLGAVKRELDRAALE